MKVGYARVSTKDQTTNLQVDALKKAGCSRIYTETLSGAQADRPALSKLMDAVRAGDVLVIWKLDRLGRSLKNLIEIVNELLQRKVGLRRKVGGDARITVAGVSYVIDPELAGETVLLWWGLFDNELYVEHGDKRFACCISSNRDCPWCGGQQFVHLVA